jgi:hypothetical protein
MTKTPRPAYVVITPHLTFGDSQRGNTFDFKGTPSEFLAAVLVKPATAKELINATIRVRAESR